MHILLILAIAVAMATGFWNVRASTRAGQGANWRTNRDGLRAPGSSQGFMLLSMVGPTLVIALAAFGAPLVASLAAGFAYAIAFAALAIRERRRAETYYRGNVGREEYVR